MKKALGLMFGWMALVAWVVVSLGSPIKADTGMDMATRKELGSYAETGSVAGSSTTGTEFAASGNRRPDGMYFNNSVGTIWIGTVTATRNNQTHDNISGGFPILSSATFSLGGQFRGSIAFTCDIGVTACQVRKFEGKVPN